jgi:hypothetical protein
MMISIGFDRYHAATVLCAIHHTTPIISYREDDFEDPFVSTYYIWIRGGKRCVQRIRRKSLEGSWLTAISSRGGRMNEE